MVNESYPTGAEVRAWCGAVTAASARFNADFVQSVKAVNIKLSVNSDMSNPFYVSDYQVPFFSTGAYKTYRTAKFDVSGLTSNTKYYWRLGYQDAANQGGVVRSFTTAPASASAFTFAVGSCSDHYAGPSNSKKLLAAPVYRSINADNPLFFLSLGDTPYCDVTTLDGAQRDLYRGFRQSSDVDTMLRAVPFLWCMSDHDYGSNDCSLDTANAAAIFAITNTVYKETFPHYSLPLDPLLTQVVTYGSTRFLLLDAYGASTYIGNTCLGSTQLAWLQTQLNQAGTDGIKWLFIGQGRTWTGAVFNGFGQAFTAERQTICDMIESCSVPVCLLVGDAHAGGFDDGTNTAFTTDGFGKFPQIFSSGLLQGMASSSGPYSWNGSSAFYHFGADAETGKLHSLYTTVTMSADNTTWTATIKGDPIDPSTFAPTTIATVSSTDVTPAVSFNNAAPTVAHGSPLTVNLDKTWFGTCSVHWAASDGQNGNISFLPNKKRASFPITFVSAGSPTITLSSPSGCTIGGTNPITVTVT